MRGICSWFTRNWKICEFIRHVICLKQSLVHLKAIKLCGVSLLNSVRVLPLFKIRPNNNKFLFDIRKSDLHNLRSRFVNIFLLNCFLAPALLHYYGTLWWVSKHWRYVLWWENTANLMILWMRQVKWHFWHEKIHCHRRYMKGSSKKISVLLIEYNFIYFF